MDLYIGGKTHPIWPDSRRIPIPPEVPEDIARDWHEAVTVSGKSERAAAALARRALQVALRKSGFKARKLYEEIDLATASPETPSSLREKLHIAREIGNDAAHPNVEEDGSLIEVTDTDLEFLFSTLLEVFDVYFVRPAKHRALMEARKEKGGVPSS